MYKCIVKYICIYLYIPNEQDCNDCGKKKTPRDLKRKKLSLTEINRLKKAPVLLKICVYNDW